MAHNLEQQDGQVAFALRGAPAWHNLANRIFAQDENVSTATMLQEAKLDKWNVRLSNVADHIPTTWRNSSDNFYVIRDNPFDQGTDVLSVVGKRYKVVQNEELFQFADNVLDNNSAKWESAGSIKNGKVVFGSLDIPKEIVLDPQGANDKTKLYLIVWTSHDGSVAVQAAITPVRVVCQNTLNLAMKGAKQSFKIRHTQTANGKVQIARQTLGLANAYMDEFDKMAHAMIAKEISAKDFNDIILAAYPKPEKDNKGSFKKWENKVDMINDIYTGEFNGMIAGNAWGAFNALTERLDWYRSARGASNEGILSAASGFDPATNAEKNRLLTIVQKTLQLV